MSPKRFEATTTSRLSGLAHHPCRERVDEHPLVATSGNSARDLVGDLVPEHVAVPRRVRLRRARQRRRPLRGAARTRSRDDALEPARVKTRRLDRDLARRPAVPRPPTPAYSPSVFSRTKSMSTSSGPRPSRGPGSREAAGQGRRFAHRSSRCRSAQDQPQSETWSGTDGSPIAPSSTASKPGAARARPPASSGRTRDRRPSPTVARSTRCRGPRRRRPCEPPRPPRGRRRPRRGRRRGGSNACAHAPRHALHVGRASSTGRRPRTSPGCRTGSRRAAPARGRRRTRAGRSSASRTGAGRSRSRGCSRSSSRRRGSPCPRPARRGSRPGWCRRTRTRPS